jgi:hypothetical protein
MNDEVTPSPAEGAPETTPAVPPDDFRAYVKWRETGALPPKEETPPATAVAEEQPQVKTEPPSEADDSTESEEEAERQRPNGRSRRIDKLTKENEQLRRESEQLRAQYAKFVEQQAKPAAEPAKPAEPSGKPRLHDYPTLEAYQEALTDWKINQREAAKEAEAANAAAERAAAKLQTDWQNSETAARTAHPDYDEIVQSVRAPDGPGVPAMRQALLEDEAGAEILYYLGQHPDEMTKIAAMPLASAAKEIGKLAVKLAPAPDSGKPKPQHVSGAPRPPAPLSRPSAGTTKKDILDEDFARSDYRGWSRAREAQLKGQ